MASLTGKIYGDEEKRKEADKEKRALEVAAEAERRKQKEIVQPEPEKSEWVKDAERLENEGESFLGRNPEEVIIGEKRTDWKNQN